MRVTQQNMVRQALLRLEERNENMDRLSRAISTGKDVVNPSDSPNRYHRSARMKETLIQHEQHSKTIQNSLAWLQTSEEALVTLNDLALEARDIAFKGADATTDDSVLASLAERIGGILDETIDVFNSNYLGKAVFAGSDTNLSTPFELTNGQVGYTGNGDGLQRSVGSSMKVMINVSGEELLNTGLTTVLLDLQAALQSQDRTAISATIDGLKSASEGVLSLSASVGSRQSILNSTLRRIESIDLNLASFISDEEDTDLAEAIVKLESEQNAYSAALRTTADITQLNIMQYFR